MDLYSDRSSQASSSPLSTVVPWEEWIETQDDPKLKEVFYMLDKSITSSQTQLDRVDTLLKMMEGKGKKCFDDTDRAIVVESRDKVKSRVEALQTSFTGRLQTYRDTIVKLQSIMTNRKDLLNDAEASTSVLTENPLMAAALAKRHMGLQELLDEAKKQLIDGVEEWMAENTS